VPHRIGTGARSTRSLAVDQELGEGTGGGVPPVVADPLDAVEVGEDEDVKQLDARIRAVGVEPLSEHPLELLEVHEAKASAERDTIGRPAGFSAYARSPQVGPYAH